MENNEDKPGKKLFKPGQVANPNGRPKGVPNKVTNQMKEMMYDFYFNNLETMQSDFDAMEAKDKMSFRAKLLPFFMPTMTATRSEKTITLTGAEGIGTKRLHQLILTIDPLLDNIEDAEYTDGD